MICSLIGSIRGKVLDIVDDVVENKAKELAEAGDIEGQWQYWKVHYNTPLGKGTVTMYVYEVSKILKEAQGR